MCSVSYIQSGPAILSLSPASLNLILPSLTYAQPRVLSAVEARFNVLQFGWGWQLVHLKKMDVKTDFPFFNLGSTSSSIGNGGQVQPLRVCVGCAGPILDQYILRVAPNLEWHAACLKCCQCQKFLDEKCTCFVRDGKIYCKEDYVRYSST